MQENINIWQVERGSRFSVSSSDDIFRYKNMKFLAFHLHLGGLFGDCCGGLKEKVEG